MIGLSSFAHYMPQAGLWVAYVQSGFIGQLIVVIQLLLSVTIWSVMLHKHLYLRRTALVARRFRKLFDNTSGTLDIYYQQRESSNPMALIYQSACDKLVRTLPAADHFAPADSESRQRSRKLTPQDMTLVKGSTEQALAEQLAYIEEGMGMVASGATAAPLLGLLGTVWGLLDAFQAMSGKGSAMLTDVAPGISSAMLTTVVGLLVAIPSSIGYNALLGRVRGLSIELDGFTDELLGRLSCEFQGRDN